MISAPTQRELPGFSLDTRITLWELGAVMACLSLDRRVALARIDGRELVAFNIGSATSRRREVRVWRDAVLAELTGAKIAHEAAGIVASILPERFGRPMERVGISGVDLQRRWSCGADLIADLIAEGSLTAGRREAVTRSPEITYASAFQFLTRRML